VCRAVEPPHTPHYFCLLKSFLKLDLQKQIIILFQAIFEDVIDHHANNPATPILTDGLMPAEQIKTIPVSPTTILGKKKLPFLLISKAPARTAAHQAGS